MGISLTVEMTKPGLPRTGQLEHHHGDASSQMQGEAMFPCAQRGAGFLHFILTPTHSSYLQGNHFTQQYKENSNKSFPREWWD